MVDQSMAGAIMWFAGDGLMMMLMIVIGGRWIVDGDRVGAGLGPWLDRVRRQATLGSDADDSIDLDDDEGPGRLQRSPRRTEPPTTRRTSAVTR